MPTRDQEGNTVADENCLTEEDRQALDALGTSKELVQRIVAAAESRKLSAAGEETQTSDVAEQGDRRKADYVILLRRSLWITDHSANVFRMC